MNCVIKPLPFVLNILHAGTQIHLYLLLYFVQIRSVEMTVGGNLYFLIPNPQSLATHEAPTIYGKEYFKNLSEIFSQRGSQNRTLLRY